MYLPTFALIKGDLKNCEGRKGCCHVLGFIPVYSMPGVPNTSIAIDRSIPKVLWVDRMALKIKKIR